MNGHIHILTTRCRIYLIMTAVLILTLTGFLSSGHAAMSVVDSKHNLSVSGPGTIKAVGEKEVCIFCHSPHHANPSGFLWNRSDPTSLYTLYNSTTRQTAANQPSGASRMCLSCHDGTIALGKVSSRFFDILMTQQLLDTGPAALTTDLSDDHPISFVYDSSLSLANPEYKDPALFLNQNILDRNNEMQCTSCHDPHDDFNGMFLREYNANSALCLTCHQPTNWAGSYHQSSSAVWNNILPDPWPHTSWTTVAENGCENCHRPHSAGGPQWLLNKPLEENNCFPCHNGNVAAKDLETEFTKLSSHPVANTNGTHSPLEDPITMTRHVECTDCHNPHQVNSNPGVAPNVSGTQSGVQGVDAVGVVTANAAFAYEICLKCHGDTASGTAPISRQYPQLNKRLQFAQTNPSSHPIMGPGQNPNVPSLLPGLTESSIIYCTDCHNNDAGPGAGGVGTTGPHGSQYTYLLEREYVTTDYTSESATVYALCYKCHDRNSILGNQSFSKHNRHLNLRRGSTPCSTCHDPHGISDSQGNAVNNSHLINFDLSVVSPDPSSGLLQFEDQGLFTGRCYLSCHGFNHSPRTY